MRKARGPRGGKPEQDPALPEIPDVVLEGQIARGGMGVVYRGRQGYLDRDVAVKLLSQHLQGKQFAARFQREAKILAGIRHPHIVGCHTAGTTTAGQSYLVMEFIDGPNLKTWIAEHGPLPVAAALRLARQLASALGHAHGLGVIHRDVKAENILLDSPTSTSLDLTFPYVPKLVDLGLARMQDQGVDPGLTAPGAVMGTPGTMAPEQFDDPDGVDFRADIYGLGCVLHEMLTGSAAFTARQLTDIVIEKRRSPAPDPCRKSPDVPSAAGRLVAEMLAPDREQRPASYRELTDRLDAITAELATGTPSFPAADSGFLSSVADPGPGAAPQLLQTAEFEFLAAGRGTGIGSGAPAGFPDPTFAPAPAASGSGATGVTFARPGSPAPAARAAAAEPAAAKPAAPAPSPPRRSRRGTIVVAVVAVLLTVGVVKQQARKRAQRRGPPPVVGSPATAKAPEPRPAEGPLAIRGLDGQVRPGVAIELAATGPRRDLSYRWSAEPGDAARLGSPAAAATTLSLQGLPGDEFTVRLEARGDGAEPQRVEQRLVLDYGPKDLLADFLARDSAWSAAPRVSRGRWERLGGGGVALIARRFPVFRTRELTGRVWRVAGELLPERQGGSDFAETAVCIRLGASQFLAISCERRGARGEEWSATLKLAQRDGRNGMAIRPLGRQPKAVAAVDDKGRLRGASFTITRRGTGLVLEFGFPGLGQVLEHEERLRAGDQGATLVLFARSGRGGFPRLQLW